MHAIQEYLKIKNKRNKKNDIGIKMKPSVSWSAPFTRYLSRWISFLKWIKWAWYAFVCAWGVVLICACVGCLQRVPASRPSAPPFLSPSKCFQLFCPTVSGTPEHHPVHLTSVFSSPAWVCTSLQITSTTTSPMSQNYSPQSF